MRVHKTIASFVLCCCSVLAAAQPPVTLDGYWLKQSVDAFNRIYVTKNIRAGDFENSFLLIGYVAGILVVHRQNNMMASILVATAADNQTKDPKTLADDMKVKTALAFAPLLGIPDDLSPQQIVAVLQKYLDAHPGKWGIPLRCSLQMPSKKLSPTNNRAMVFVLVRCYCGRS